MRTACQSTLQACAICTKQVQSSHVSRCHLPQALTSPSGARTSALESGRPFTAARPKMRPRTQRQMCVAASAGSSSSSEEPKMAADAIAQGLTAYQDGDYEGALELFQKALKLPGTGMKRYRDKPNEASPEEKQAALYNTACCLGKLGSSQEGLYAVAGCLEAGYADFGQLRKDPDLAPLRENPKFEGLLKRFEPKQGGFFSPLMKGFN